MTNLAEATADPDPANGLNQIEVHPLADGPILNMNNDGIRNFGGALDLHAPAQNIHHHNPPGSPLLRMNLHDPDPGGPPDEVP